MAAMRELPLPVLDALPLGAHRLMVLTDEALAQACGVRIMYTDRSGGVSVGPFGELNLSPDINDDALAVERNIQIVREAAHAEKAGLVALEQVHGTRVVVAGALAESGGAVGGEPVVASVEDSAAIAGGHGRQQADGVVVGEADIAALLISADCPLLVVVSPSGRFAVAHAGWRGVVGGIAGKAVMCLARDDSCEPADFNAYLGPHICPDCFEVGEDVAQRFVDAFGPGSVLRERHVSLAHAISADLVRCGMSASRIRDAGLCTCCHPQRFFSYRATGGACGRQGVFVVRMRET